MEALVPSTWYPVSLGAPTAGLPEGGPGDKRHAAGLAQAARCQLHAAASSQQQQQRYPPLGPPSGSSCYMDAPAPQAHHLQPDALGPAWLHPAVPAAGRSRGLQALPTGASLQQQQREQLQQRRQQCAPPDTDLDSWLGGASSSPPPPQHQQHYQQQQYQQQRLMQPRPLHTVAGWGDVPSFQELAWDPAASAAAACSGSSSLLPQRHEQQPQRQEQWQGQQQQQQQLQLHRVVAARQAPLQQQQQQQQQQLLLLRGHQGARTLDSSFGPEAAQEAPVDVNAMVRQRRLQLLMLHEAQQQAEQQQLRLLHLAADPKQQRCPAWPAKRGREPTPATQQQQQYVQLAAVWAPAPAPSPWDDASGPGSGWFAYSPPEEGQPPLVRQRSCTATAAATAPDTAGSGSSGCRRAASSLAPQAGWAGPGSASAPSSPSAQALSCADSGSGSTPTSGVPLAPPPPLASAPAPAVLAAPATALWEAGLPWPLTDRLRLLASWTADGTSEPSLGQVETLLLAHDMSDLQPFQASSPGHVLHGSSSSSGGSGMVVVAGHSEQQPAFGRGGDGSPRGRASAVAGAGHAYYDGLANVAATLDWAPRTTSGLSRQQQAATASAW